MAFATPPEILDFHEGRRTAPSFSRVDVTSHDRAHLFTAARATDPDLLDVLKSSITDALASGFTFETWARMLVPRLAVIGWGSPRLVADPLGQRAPERVDFTDPERLRSVFWEGMAVPRTARQWSVARRTQGGLPYVLYGGPAPVNACAGHRAWAGLILPVEHPWWARHWPPNGWNCTCHLRQITARERDRLLAQGIGPNGCAYRAEPTDEDIGILVLDRSGRQHVLPPGLDFGWDGNPGLDRARPLG